MSFESEIYNVMTTDTSLNAYVDIIQYQNLDDNWLGGDTEDKWIVYDVRRSSQEDCINKKNLFTLFQLSIILIQRGTNNEIDIITNHMIDYLNNHQSGGIQDIKFVNDQLSFNQQQNTYTNSLEFECVYVNS